MAQKEEVSFKDTLNLPRTSFPIRPNANIDDPAMVARWEESDLYKKTFKVNINSGKKYLLHMGPPYANGHAHLGHAYTTILKDIIAKSHRMAGCHAPVTPGWDCHGLPIEIKVLQENLKLSRIEFKKACRNYAQHWVNTQRSEFKRLGILMDWDNPYLTMSPSYESSTVRALGYLLEKGFIERKNKSVAWCFSCKTVLAAAEIEYKDRKDPSIYVKFLIDIDDTASLFKEAAGEKVHFLIWTTTPWTLPLNRAVAVKPDAEYVLVRLKGQLLILGLKTLDLVEALVKEKATILKKFFGDYLAGVKVQHPFDKDRKVPVIFDENVALNEGTACVHIAPGCGPSDYELGIRNNLEIFSPLTGDGKYSQGVVPADLEGMSILDAQGEVIKRLAAEDNLFFKSTITHSYPHCWRCHNGLMFRATKQWFFNLQHENIKQKTLDAIENIEFFPPQGRNFLKATVASRLEWCISRQKIWGVPIPALLCTQCDTAYCPPDFVEKIAKAIEQEGVEYWDRITVEELTKDKCVQCSVCKSTDFVKELDILDVWFEAGVSHYAVLNKNENLWFPADLYLEAIDQHRGWFQSSLLTALAIEKEAPMKGIFTHGFTVDEKGQKMSKSLGNVVEPLQVVNKLGTDGLRLWVISVGREGDILVSDTLLNNISEVFRKIRNTSRFLLANLYDFDSEFDKVPIESLLPIDRAILSYLYEINKSIINDYHSGNMPGVFHTLGDFCAVRLSSWYLDIIKDRLYVEKANGHLRRSAQTTCWYLLDTLVRLMAPVMSFTAEQLTDLYQKNKKESIHLQQFNNVPNIWELIGARKSGHFNFEKEFSCEDGSCVSGCTNCSSYVDYQTSVWCELADLRTKILKAIEIEREKGLIKHSLEARVKITGKTTDPAVKAIKEWAKEYEKIQSLESFFEEFLIVSQVEFILSDKIENKWDIQVEHARGSKCPRCWKWHENVNEYDLCIRCNDIVVNSKK